MNKYTWKTCKKEQKIVQIGSVILKCGQSNTLDQVFHATLHIRVPAHAYTTTQ